MDIRLRLAVQALQRGELIAYPTEAVWGLGCDPWNAGAVERLLELKQRDVAKGLILVAGDIAQVSPWLDALTGRQRSVLKASWPGPVTWLVPDHGIAPDWIRGEHDSVALRVSAHPLVQQLCLAFGRPVVSTSANPAGKPAARTAFAVRRYFGKAIGTLLPGETGGRTQPSEIRDLLTGRTLRHG